MNRLSSTICSRCRHDAPTLPSRKIFARARSTTSTKVAQRSKPARSSHYQPSSWSLLLKKTPLTTPIPSPKPLSLAVEDVAEYLGKEVQGWSNDPRLFRRLSRFGISTQDLQPLLAAFVLEVKQGNVISALQYRQNELSRIAYDLSQFPGNYITSRYLTKILFEWAAHPSGRAILADKVSPSILTTMGQLFEAADLTRPWVQYPQTRAARTRKFIMHVGPTNSGKTHNALRALAAADRGVYAGPLRLLAHEVWERLNKGQIVPLGVDPDADADADLDTNIDVGDQSSGPVVRKDGNVKYARECNMITGEEQKIVSDAAKLISCTVEMLPSMREYDVAVVDEIQLIADPERGGAWVAAVLGLDATEIHLCGEETAVPLVEAMARDTADEVIVHRYERLSPLRVADSSLHGDLSRVEKGDCLVAFSRKQIFAMKKTIEHKTNLRCAVAYGRLPPEVRSEQAALFNRPDSGYDVLVGSDAIGMGLNLKIKRIIFEAVRKYNGVEFIPLSMSQTKQIAGRAGRFGLHGSDSSGGVVTTLEAADLPFIGKALAAPLQPLRFAVISPKIDIISTILQTLPAGTAMNVALEVLEYVSKMHPLYMLPDMDKWNDRVKFVDDVAGELTLVDRMMLENAPTPWRDDVAVEVIRRMMILYRTQMQVGLEEVLRKAGLWDRFDKIVADMKSGGQPSGFVQNLAMLESLHKVVVLYLWLSYRVVVAFPDQDEAHRIRMEAEKAMDWCLDAMTADAGKPSVARHSRNTADNIKYSSRQEALQQRMSLLKRRDTYFQVPVSTSPESNTSSQPK